MRPMRVLFVVLLAIAPTAMTRAASSFSLGDGTAAVGASATIELSLSSDEPVQGLTAAIEWNGAELEAVALTPADVLAGADTVVTRLEGDYAVLGVIVDDDGVGDPALPIGDQVLAAIEVRCRGAVETTELRFADGKYAVAEGGPLLDNLVVVEGQTIDRETGLGLSAGSVTCGEGVTRLSFDDRGRESKAGVLLSNTGPVEGYTVAVCHAPSDLSLRSIEVGAAAIAVGVEFSAASVFDGGGTLAVIFDIDAPFQGQALAVGDRHEIAVFEYECLSPGAPTRLEFCDAILGEPALANTVVIAGLSVAPVRSGITYECAPADPCGPEICGNGVDDDCDGSIDEEDCASVAFSCGPRKAADIGQPILGTVGSDVELCFFLETREDHAVGELPQFDHVQGFSMGVAHPCSLTAGKDFDISGTILEAIGAEFVSLETDAVATDGDGCELVIGVLVDALPPFDGATIPPLDGPQRMGCLTMTIADDEALCGTPLAVEFVDGVNIAGQAPVKNLVSVENTARAPALISCEIEPVSRGRFYRGDCDFSGGEIGLALNINDAGAMISFFFHDPAVRFEPPCLDACDCNDDGRLDLADTTCVLRFLFRSGPIPPPPGPGVERVDGGFADTRAGIDPTFDLLDCVEGSRCD